MNDKFYGLILFLGGIIIIYLKIRKKGPYKGIDNPVDSFLGIYGWGIAILMVILGLYLLML